MNNNAKRGRVRPWRPEEDAYVRAHYATMRCDAIAFFLRRTQCGVWKRASRLGLEKQNSTKFQPGHTIGPRFAPGNIPANKGKRTKLRIWERVELLFEEHAELTQADMSKLLGVPLGSLSGSLRQAPKHVCHIDRWMIVGKHWVGVYAKGPGADADKPNRRADTAEARARLIADASKPLPIPRPQLGPWGCVWNTTQAVEAA